MTTDLKVKDLTRMLLAVDQDARITVQASGQTLQITSVSIINERLEIQTTDGQVTELEKLMAKERIQTLILEDIRSKISELNKQ